MKRPQARQDTAPDPARVFPLHDIPGRLQSHLHRRPLVGKLVIEAGRETGEETGSADDDDVVEKMALAIGVDGGERGFAEAEHGRFVRGRGHRAAGAGIAGERGLFVEEAFGGPILLQTEDVVPAIGHLEGPARFALADVVGCLRQRLPVHPCRLPHVDNGFFELREHAFLLEPAERCRRLRVGKCVVGGLCGLCGVDGGLGCDEVVRSQGRRGCRLREEQTDLVGDEVASDG